LTDQKSDLNLLHKTKGELLNQKQLFFPISLFNVLEKRDLDLQIISLMRHVLVSLVHDSNILQVMCQ